MASFSAARTNLSSQSVDISDIKLGEGSFRVAYRGTYRGGSRNQQAAACKKFKPQFRSLEDEYFRNDFRIADKAIAIAEDWNRVCPLGKEILVTRGDVKRTMSGEKYLIEPEIRYYTKFTSNSGWIAPGEGDDGLAMEAFCHYTYHRSGGSLIVCDLQGRYKKNMYSKKMMKSRFELTDPAICSRARTYGPTDLGEKGIESFFANHCCNKFCNRESRWQRPRAPTAWFESSSITSMFSSSMTPQLTLRSSARFTLNHEAILECDEEESDDDY